MNENFEQDILSAIKDKKIIPIPKWNFRLRQCFLWLTFVVSMVLGGLTFSAASFLLRQNDWDQYRGLTGGLWSFVFLSLPYFWLVFMGLFIILTYYNFHYFKKAYKFRPYLIIILTLLASLLLGVLFDGLGLGRFLENSFGRKAPGLYEVLIFDREDIWVKPQVGLLAGVVVDVPERDSLELEDFSGRDWLVLTANINNQQISACQLGQAIKIIGRQVADNVFEASEIRPWTVYYNYSCVRCAQ